MNHQPPDHHPPQQLPSAGPYQAPPPYPQPNPVSGTRIGLGLGLLAVPVLALLVAYVLPTLSTLAMSTQSSIAFDRDPEPAGSANWERLFAELTFLDGFAELAIPVLGTVITGAVFAPLMAWCFHAAGAGVRTAARIVFGAAALAFAPSAMAVAWYLEHFDDPNRADLTLLEWTTMISGVVLGAGVLVALAAFRGGTDTGRRVATVVAAGALTAFALIAAGLQTYTFPYVTGVPSGSAPVPLVQIHRTAFALADTGVAAAMSSLLLAVLALLGLGAGLLFILAKVRVDIGPGRGEPRRFGVGAGIGSIALIAIVGVGLVVSLWPWLSRLTVGTGTSADLAEILVNTWVPPLITTVIAMTAAVAGGLAIGALRPLGEGTRWLLLVFAPWLFVGTGPLALSHFKALSEAEQLGSFLSLAPRAWIAVPALFVFTALFWGLEDRRRAEVAAGAPVKEARKALAARAWPLIVLIGLVVWIVNAQDIMWQYTAGFGDRPTAATDVVTSVQSYAAQADMGVGSGHPIITLLVTTAVMITAAILYLPRVGIRIGR